MKLVFFKTIALLFVFAFSTTHVLGQKKAKLTPETKEDLKTAKVLLVRYQAPPLSFMTPKSAVGAGLIADLTKSDIAENREPHRYYPEERIQQNLAQLLQESNLMNSIEVKEDASEFMMPAKLKDVTKYADVDADYIMEVIVPLMGWRASYAPLKWQTYHLNLALEVRIIRKSDLARVWKTNVGYGGLVDKEMRFHITELEENGKELIDTKVNTLAMEASKKVLEKFIKAKK